jgi:hypothetical protein
MTSPEQADAREQFEAWARHRGMNLGMKDGDYFRMSTFDAWETWKAALAAVALHPAPRTLSVKRDEWQTLSPEAQAKLEKITGAEHPDTKRAKAQAAENVRNVPLVATPQVHQTAPPAAPVDALADALTNEQILAAIKGTDAGFRLAGMLGESVRIADFQAALVACVRAAMGTGTPPDSRLQGLPPPKMTIAVEGPDRGHWWSEDQVREIVCSFGSGASDAPLRSPPPTCAR